MTQETKDHLIRWTVTLLRIIIGSLFVLSGIVKDIDLWGTVYKIEEYLHVWHVTEPRTIVFMGAMLLSGAEFLLGALLLLGCCRRAAPVLLTVLMAGMLPLTLYIYIFNPVSDCGCFGDFIVLSNGATFWKNVIITCALIFLIRFNKHVAPLFSPYLQWLVIVLLAGYAIIIGLYGYNIQPLIDFRSFPVGEKLLPDDNDIEQVDDASDNIIFIYEKNGQKKEFRLNNLPDSTWTFIDRLETSSPGESVSTELVVYDLDGNDSTTDAIASAGEQMILVIPQLSRAEVSWTYFLNELCEYMENHGGSMIALVAGDDASVEAWADLSMASYPFFTAEATTLKELARGNMALVYVKDGRVVWKRSMAMMDTSMTNDMLFKDEGPEIIFDNGSQYFKALTVTLVIVLTVLYLLDSTGRLVKWRLARKRKMRESATDE